MMGDEDVFIPGYQICGTKVEPIEWSVQSPTPINAQMDSPVLARPRRRRRRHNVKITSVAESGSEEDSKDEGYTEDPVPPDVIRDMLRRIRGDENVSDSEVESVAVEAVQEVTRNVKIAEALSMKSEINMDIAEEVPLPEQLDFSWTEDYSTFSGQDEEYARVSGPLMYSSDPVELFEMFWDQAIMYKISIETNRYAAQKLEEAAEVEGGTSSVLANWTETTVEELYKLFAVLIYMSFCDRARIDEYWTTSVLEMPNFRSIMSRNRFTILLRFLHFVNNKELMPASHSYRNKVSKIKPILDHCNEKFSNMYVPKKHLSLDESLLLWKGRLSWVQCIRSKATRFGIKTFDLCEAETGYLLRSILYPGKESAVVDESIHGFKNSTAKIVLKLTDGYLELGHTLVMDNWYNQIRLTRFLKSHKTDVLGTLNRNRTHLPDDIKALNPKRVPRGQTISRHCGDISCVSWKDVKLVTVMSTCHKDEMVSVSRGGKMVQKPLSIHEYDKYMGGVDRKDQILSMYKLERKRGNKWYIKVFKRLLNSSLLNLYIIYCRGSGLKMQTHREFRYSCASGLLKKYQVPTAVQRTRLAPDIRLDTSRRHFPVLGKPKENRPDGPSKVPTKMRRRCARCSALGIRTAVTTECSDCNVALCIGQCWLDYHSLTHLGHK